MIFLALLIVLGNILQYFSFRKSLPVHIYQYYPQILHNLWLVFLVPVLEEWSVNIFHNSPILSIYSPEFREFLIVLLFLLTHYSRINSVGYPFLYSLILVYLRLLCDSGSMIERIIFHMIYNCTIVVNVAVLSYNYSKYIHKFEYDEHTILGYEIPLPIYAFIVEFF